MHHLASLHHHASQTVKHFTYWYLRPTVTTYHSHRGDARTSASSSFIAHLSLNLIFSIRVHPLILLAMVAFLRSQWLAEVLTLFLELCQLSRSKIFPLHKGAVNLLLLRAFQDSFRCRGRSLEFNFGDHRRFFISEHIPPLISSM
jgi:hypothetical protein